jgi:outer membrane protein assembly factor BamD
MLRVLPLLLLVAALGLTACAAKVEPYVERPVDELYNLGMDSLAEGNWSVASRNFEEVERQHPYSNWASKAQLMNAYVLYMDNKYDEAILAAQRFTQLYPANKDVSYAYYLIAVSYYEQIVDVGRDQRNTNMALNALEEVVRRFPTSEYARDARLKVDLARDHLAGKEMEIGRYYLRRGQIVSAINRFRWVVDNFQTTSHVPEALHRLTEAYTSLGIRREAQATAAVLGHNFPGSTWYQQSYALVTGEPLDSGERPGWFGRNIGRIF